MKVLVLQAPQVHQSRACESSLATSVCTKERLARGVDKDYNTREGICTQLSVREKPFENRGFSLKEAFVKLAEL